MSTENVNMQLNEQDFIISYISIAKTSFYLDLQYQGISFAYKVVRVITESFNHRLEHG